MTRQIYADYDDDGIYVYQAYKPEIARAAVQKGTFAEGFGLDRMTWIKPSFGWMLYRSGYATKQNQEAILRIKLRQIVRAYVNEWIIRLEEVTALAHAIHEAVKQTIPVPEVPEEHFYAVDDEIQQRLGTTGEEA